MLKRLMLLGGATLFSLLLLEILLRIVGISYASLGMVDPVVGWSARPGAEALKATEGRSYVVISSDGLRDHEHEKKKPDDVFRILVLGDSFTFANHVELEETYWSILERELEGCSALAGRKPESINLGITGYGTSQELLLLRDRGWQWDPDLVLVGFFSGNDVVNNSPALSKADKLKPFLLLDDGGLVLDDSFRDSDAYARKRQTYAILYYSRLAQVAKQSWLAYKSSKRKANKRASDDAAFLSFQNDIYAEPGDDVWREAWEITEAVLAQMNREVKAKGAQLVVSTLSNPLQVYPDPKRRAELHESLEIVDPSYPDRRLAQIAEREGFGFIDLATPMSELSIRDDVYYHGFENTRWGTGHWNRNGHGTGGRLMAEGICRILSERQASSGSRGGKPGEGDLSALSR